jgi:hypothetical protein
MNFRHRSLLIVAVAVVISLPLLGMSGVASAKAAKGCDKTHSCKSGAGTGTGTTTPGPMTIQVDPNPVIATSSSAVVVVIQIETSPSFAGDLVDITSTQLQASCSEGIGFANVG